MKFINQAEPWLDDKEATAINDYLKSGGWLTEFKKTAELEKLISEFTGANYCSMVCNGTVSLTIALMALGLQKGDDVIVPDFTMIASSNAVILGGGRPVLVDVEPENLCLDLRSLKSSVTEKTKGIILVTINGRYPSKYEEITDYCQRENLFVLEDAAQSLGSFKGGKHLGTFGDIGSLSFSSPKIITTGQGGALITDSEELHARIRALKDFGREKGGTDHHDSIGYNFKFTDLQAVIGIEQMKKLPYRVKRKKDIFRLYQDLLKNVDQLSLLPTNLVDATPWFIDIYVPDPLALHDYLKNNNIGSRSIYPPIHMQPAYKDYQGSFPVTERLSAQGLWLPSSSRLKDSQIEYVCDTIKDYYSQK